MSSEVSGVIERFYEAFSSKDFEEMARCYHPKATFKDEVFSLDAKQIPAMWHMLCIKGKDLIIHYSDVEYSANTASANWVAHYTFKATGKKVTNEIAASFILEDGLIKTHTDDFDFHKWAVQALGFTGLILGWSGFLKNKVRNQAADSLNTFISKHPEYQD